MTHYQLKSDVYESRIRWTQIWASKGLFAENRLFFPFMTSQPVCLTNMGHDYDSLMSTHKKTVEILMALSNFRNLKIHDFLSVLFAVLLKREVRPVTFLRLSSIH